VGQKDPRVWIFYRKRDQNFLCVVVKILDGEGFIITIYPTDKIKKGENIWPK